MHEEAYIYGMPRSLLRELLKRMIMTTRTEESLEKLYHEGLVHGTVHFCIGEEAASVGSAMALHRGDYVFTTHRGHGAAIGKGADIGRMIAEILGRTGSSNGGIGGSMHVTDPAVGVVGGNGVVGAGVPIALGAALAVKVRHEDDKVAACYFGDGAANQGAVLESMNLASVLGLPVIFILIDNQYAVSTRVERASADTDFTKRAAAFHIEAFTADGDDVLAVYRTTSEARDYTALTGAPSLIVLRTYRVSGHSRSDDDNYRSLEEIVRHTERDPVRLYMEELRSRGILSEEEIRRIERAATDDVQEALDYALRQPEADSGARQLERIVYAE